MLALCCQFEKGSTMLCSSSGGLVLVKEREIDRKDRTQGTHNSPILLTLRLNLKFCVPNLLSAST